MIKRYHQPHPLLTLFLSTIILSQVALCRRERHRQTVLINYKEPISDSNCAENDQRDSEMLSSIQNEHSRHHYYAKEDRQSYESSQHTKHTPKHVKKKRLRCRLIESNTESSSNQPRQRNKHNRGRKCSCDERHSHSTRERNSDNENERSRKNLKKINIASSSSIEHSKRKNSVSISIKLKQKAHGDIEDSATCSDKITYTKKGKESIFSSSSDEDISDNQSTKQSVKCSLSNKSESNDSFSHRNTKKINKCKIACAKSLKKAKQIKNTKRKSNCRCCTSCNAKNRNLSSNKEKRREIYSTSSDLDSHESCLSCRNKRQEVYSSNSEKMDENSSKSSSSSQQTSSSSSNKENFPGVMNPHHPFWPFPFPSRPCLGDANRLHGQEYFNYNPFMHMPYVFGILSKQKLNNGKTVFPNHASKTCKCKKDGSHYN